jgi:hypothetical protein
VVLTRLAHRGFIFCIRLARRPSMSTSRVTHMVSPGASSACSVQASTCAIRFKALLLKYAHDLAPISNRSWNSGRLLEDLN